MTMGRCRECKKPVSSEAAACPSCGVAKPYVAKKIGLFGWVGVTMVGGIFFSTCSSIDRSSRSAASAAPNSTSAQSSAQTAAEIQANNRQALQRLKPAEVRAIMKGKLLEVCERASPSLNYIKTEIRGTALYCVHSFYSEHTLSIGSLAPIMSAWVGEWEAELKMAGIKRVGVFGSGDYPSGSWFNIK